MYPQKQHTRARSVQFQSALYLLADITCIHKNASHFYQYVKAAMKYRRFKGAIFRVHYFWNQVIINAWMHCKEKKQKHQLVVNCTTRRSKLLKFIFRQLVLFSIWTESDNPDATCELSPQHKMKLFPLVLLLIIRIFNLSAIHRWKQLLLTRTIPAFRNLPI